MVMAVFAGNYNQPQAWRLPVKVLTEFVAPALRAQTGGGLSWPSRCCLELTDARRRGAGLRA